MIRVIINEFLRRSRIKSRHCFAFYNFYTLVKPSNVRIDGKGKKRKVKVKLYRSVVRPILLYGSEC
jgi:hypothetical protein